jgi:hypothetical protein
MTLVTLAVIVSAQSGKPTRNRKANEQSPLA